jgi:hypothetical protein
LGPDDGYRSAFDGIEIEGYDRLAISYHLVLMAQAELIDCEKMRRVLTKRSAPQLRWARWPLRKRQAGLA